MDIASKLPADPWSQTAPDPSATPRNPAWKRSVNHARARPAKEQVISSILSSLDTVTPLPNPDQFADSASKHSHVASANRPAINNASAYRNFSSPGFGVEYGTGLQLDEEEGLSDAALAPTVPTSRPPSGLSHHTATRSSSSNKAGRFLPSSRRSSFSAPGSPSGSARKKLSSESWVRRPPGGDTDDNRSIVSSRGRTQGRALRRVSSLEKLRPDEDPNSSEGATPLTSLSEHIISKTSHATPSSSKGRLYLTDATINEDQSLEESPDLSGSHLSFPSPPSHERAPDIDNENRDPLDKDLKANPTPPHKSPSSISDSIPTRTSSLRQSSRSPAVGKKKHRKSKRDMIIPLSEAIVPNAPSKRSKIIPDSSWADLGDDDGTVKRIKQLREQRNLRLEQGRSVSSPVALEFDILPSPLSESSIVSAGVRAVAKDPAGALPGSQSLLKVEDAEPLSRRSSGGGSPGSSVAGTSCSARTRSAVHSPRSRPPTSKSEDASAVPVEPLDYSYAQAVDALDRTGAEEGTRAPDGTKQTREHSKQSSLRLKGLGIPGVTDAAPAPGRSKSKASEKAARPSQEPWVASGHPNVQLEFDRKRNRRKSMSDARRDEADQLGRRDSIEDAVLDFLNAPRLSRTVKDVKTGRVIAFSEIGDPDGAAVLVCVGMGLTRYVTAFFDELATLLHLRLITIDRPGVGGSQPLASSDTSGPLNWPEDVLAVCQHLGIIKFSILAHSAGAIYALATALILPHLVKGKVHLLAPWVPPSQLEAISHSTTWAPPASPLPRSQRFLRVLPTPFLKAANASFMTATSASLKPAPRRTTRTTSQRTTPRKAVDSSDIAKRPMSRDRPDYSRRESMMLMDQLMPTTNPLEHFPLPVKELKESKTAWTRGSLIVSATASPTDPNFAYAISGLDAAEHAEKERQTEYISRLTQQTWERATRDSNPATDLMVCLERQRDVGFRYTDVGREIVITHGSEDKRVPINNVKWLGEQMNRRQLGMSLSDADTDELRADSLPVKGGCEVRILEGQGHGLMASPTIMGDILTEIAGYWTGHDRGRA